MKQDKNKTSYANTTTYKINGKESDYLFVKTSQLPNSGKGLYTAIDIYKNEVIAIFKGELLTTKEVANRIKNELDAYFINKPDGKILDSITTKCFAKYANDAKASKGVSYKNNAIISLDEDDNICLVANRTIKSGEEIFCGYGKNYWKNYSKKTPSSPSKKGSIKLKLTTIERAY